MVLVSLHFTRHLTSKAHLSAIYPSGLPPNIFIPKLYNCHKAIYSDYNKHIRRINEEGPFRREIRSIGYSQERNRCLEFNVTCSVANSMFTSTLRYFTLLLLLGVLVLLRE